MLNQRIPSLGTTTSLHVNKKIYALHVLRHKQNTETACARLALDVVHEYTIEEIISLLRTLHTLEDWNAHINRYMFERLQKVKDLLIEKPRTLTVRLVKRSLHSSWIWSIIIHFKKIKPVRVECHGNMTMGYFIIWTVPSNLILRNCLYILTPFLAQLTMSARAFPITMCPSSVCLSIRLSVC